MSYHQHDQYVGSRSFPPHSGLQGTGYHDSIELSAPHQGQAINSGDIDVEEINRFLSGKDSESHPFAPVQRPQSPNQAWPSFPGAADHSNRHFQYQHKDPASGNSSVTASDSAYHSIPATSGPQVTSYPAQQQAGDYYPLSSLPENGQNGTSFASGQGDARSEPSTRDPRRQQPRGSRSRAKSHVAPCWCGKELKNPSDAHKHALQHEKPHKCQELGCSRHEGFATQNDLQRHRASVHKLLPTVGRRYGYICRACPMQQMGKYKFWPRRDNFKAHIKRKHGNFDADQLIEASTCARPEDAVTESGYASAPSQLDPLDHNFPPELSSPITPSLPGHASQPGDYPFDFGNHTQGDELAGVGVGFGRSTDADMGFRESDTGLHRSDGRHGLSLLSAAATMGHLHSPPIDSVMPTPNQPLGTGSQPWMGESMNNIVSQPEFTMQWSPEPGMNSSQSVGGASQEAHLHSPRDAEGNVKCPHPGCTKTKKRECDLRKHMKRHTRPYGCTFPDCRKDFGSRNDWKRHETSQHFLQEMWRCNLLLRPHRKCGHLVHNREVFRQHLHQAHEGYSQSDYDNWCESMRLGMNGHNRFWCGFCNDLIPLSGDWALNALESRYKHIGDHYDKEDKNIDDWICVRGNERRADLRARGEQRNNKGSNGRARKVSILGTFEGVPQASSFVQRTPGQASCAPSMHDPDMRGEPYTHSNKRRRRSHDEDADAVSDDEWQPREASYAWQST